MACVCRSFCVFLLIVRCALPVKRDLPVSTASKHDEFKIAQEYSWQNFQINKYGLSKCKQQQGQCQQIGIVGAGVAGLYCAILLAEAGHKVTIFEATDRAGGRVHTYRDPKDPSKYIGELGAMRFPLGMHPYVNYLIRQRYKLNITEFPNSVIQGNFTTEKQVNRTQEQTDKSSTDDKLRLEAVSPYLEMLLEETWPLTSDRSNLYSTKPYFNKVNLPPTIDQYLDISNNFEANPSIGISQFIHPEITKENDDKMYQIQGGSDLLVQSMVADCQKIDSYRCSIQYSVPISHVQFLPSNHVQLTAKNNISTIFDSVFVATTATVAQLIDFEPRVNFLEKYLVLQQVPYVCATKILLSFNVSWWYTEENISGGELQTDLLIRLIYYPNTNSNQTEGGTITASYTFTQDSMIWQSFSEAEAIDLALKLLIRIHKSVLNIRGYFQGGKVKHWCLDPYERGAFADPRTPPTESELIASQSSISNIHFIGEYTTSNRAWVEGALSSAIRGAASIANYDETIFDVIIIGGGPIGLITAIRLSVKQPTFRIAIIDKGIITSLNHGVNSFDQRQFRQIYNEEYLAALANMSYPLWRELEQMANMTLGSILNTNDGYLFVQNVNVNQSTVDGDFISMKRTCEKRRMACEYLNSTQLRIRYPTFSFPHESLGIFHRQSGYINVDALMKALLHILAQKTNVIIRQQEEFLSLQINNGTQIITNRGTLFSRKVLLTTGPYAKNISHLLNFDLNITLWELPIFYFRLLPNVTQLPTWLSWDGNDQQSLFFSFPKISTSSDYVVISPRFIRNLSKPLIYPSQQTNTVDDFLTQKVIEWVSRHMALHVNISDYYASTQTCLATFLPDNEFLLDYVPQTDRRVLMQAAGWSMKFVPVWGDIISDMILFDEAMNTSSKYAQYMEYFSLSRPNRLIGNVTISNKGFRTASMCFLTLTLLFHVTFFERLEHILIEN